MHAVIVHKVGGPEVLKYEKTQIPSPKENEVLIKTTAIGVNFHDIYTRTGLYPPSYLPFIIGKEATGVVMKVGKNVKKFKVGERVGSASLNGAYAEYVKASEKEFIPLPAKIDDKTACALLLQGTTAQYLAKSTYKIKKGDKVLIHAAAGGVGGLLVQIAKMLGAEVYGTVSTDEKAAIAKKLGAKEVINYKRSDFEKEIMKLTRGQGVDVVYDSVGKDTYEKSLRCLGFFGMLVLFGQSSGRMPPVDPILLYPKSLYFTRPKLFDYIRTHDDLLQRAKDVFDWVIKGKLKVRIAKTYRLEDAPIAHRDLVSRKFSGKLLLIPSLR